MLVPSALACDNSAMISSSSVHDFVILAVRGRTQDGRIRSTGIKQVVSALRPLKVASKLNPGVNCH